MTAVLALGTMLLLAPFIANLPQATLAAVVIVYSIGLIKPAEFRAIRTIRRTELLWALTALIGVVFLGTLQGIVVAVCVSILALAYQESDPPLYAVRRKPGTDVLRPVATEHPCLTGLNPEVLELVRRSALGAVLGRERMLFDLEQAVTQFGDTAARQSNPTAKRGTR